MSEQLKRFAIRILDYFEAVINIVGNLVTDVQNNTDTDSRRNSAKTFSTVNETLDRLIEVIHILRLTKVTMNNDLITRSRNQFHQVDVIDVVGGINKATTKQDLNTLNKFHIRSNLRLTLILIALFKESTVANGINDVLRAGLLEPINRVL